MPVVRSAAPAQDLQPELGVKVCHFVGKGFRFGDVQGIRSGQFIRVLGACVGLDAPQAVSQWALFVNAAPSPVTTASGWMQLTM